MTGWHEGTLFAFDTETTGTSVFEDRIVSATIVRLVDGKPAAHKSWLINPEHPIHPDATAVHGITDDHVQEHGAPATDAIHELSTTVIQILRSRSRLVVFNAGFDLSLLQVECGRHGHNTLTDRLQTEHWQYVIDPLVLARGIDKNLSRSFRDPKTGKGWVYKLPALCERYKVKFTEAHDASADAIGAAQLAIAIGRKHRQVAEYPPEQLHTLQRTWHKANQDSLRAYFDKNGTEHDGCDGGWPMHTDLISAQGVLR